MNTHAQEDETHSLLLLDDGIASDMDDFLGWTAGELYWWLTCDQTVNSRRVNFELVSLVYHHQDPLMRFAIVESMEAAGEIFFTRTVPVVKALQERTGKSYPYFGEYHLARETGHLQHADEREFFKTVLSAEQREYAFKLVARVFEIFDFHFNEWERLARTIDEKRWDYQPALEAKANTALRVDEVNDLSACTSLSYPSGLTGTGRELAEYRTQAFEELWQMPFYTWIRETQPADFRQVYRHVWLQWVVDNWACADYFMFDTTYLEPATPLERGLNRLSTLFASEMKRRYVEWEALQMDEYTQWKPTEALRHYWLDARVEEQRAVFADLRKLTFRYPKPLHRYWIMTCFARFGDALMHSLGVAMRQAQEQAEDFVAIAGFPERMHPELPPDPEADQAIAELLRQDLSQEDRQIIREIITLTRNQEAERATLGWKVIQEKRFAGFARQWQLNNANLSAGDDNHPTFPRINVGADTGVARLLYGGCEGGTVLYSSQLPSPMTTKPAQ